MPKVSTAAFGEKANLAAALTGDNPKVNEYDVIHFTDTQELGWIDQDKNLVMATPRTQTAIEVNGVTGLGIANGSTIPAGKSIDEIIKALVQKPVAATYTKPTVSIANAGGTAAGNYEAGTTITPKVRATFNKNDAGGLTSITIKQGGTEVATGATSPLDYNGEEYALGDETITFNAIANYTAATVKQNNLGDESKENWFDAGTVNSSNFSIVGKRNMFWGTGVGSIPELTSDYVRGLANKQLGAGQGTSLTINVAVGQQFIVIAYPATIRDINSVTYVEANDSGMASNFNKSVINVADARGGENGMVEYKVFTYEMAVPAAATMTFKVTI